MGLEPVTSVMSSHYAETVKPVQVSAPEKAVAAADSQAAQIATSTGLSGMEIVPVMNNDDGRDAEQQGKQKQPSEKTIKEAVSQVNSRLKQSRTNCAFSYDDVTNRVSIKVYDAETEEVIKEIPPEESLKLVEKMWELAGLIVDEKH